MLNNIQIFKYIDNNSVIHQIDSLNKLITLLIFTFISLIENNIIFHIILLIYLLILICLSRIKIINYIKSIKNIFYLLISVFLVNMICRIDIILNMVYVFRIIEIVVYSSLITMSTKTNELIYGLYRLLIPMKIFKLNINKLVFILTSSIKFIPIIIDEFNKILKGLMSKGINRKNKLLLFKSIIIPTFSLSLRQSDLLGTDLELKLYDYNNIEKYNKWNIKETIILAIYILVLILVWR